MDQAQQLRNIVKKHNKKEHLARVITVTSGKGGVGKSNVSLNLAIQLSRLDKRVVVLDADFGLANVEVMLGIRPEYNLADLIFHGRALRDVVSRGPENIGFISGGSGLRELTNLNSDQIQSLVRMMYELDNIADVVIIDTGAGISDSVIDLVLASSEVLLVATPEPTSITDAYALLKTLCRHEEFYENNTKIRMVANRARGYNEGKELFDKLDTVVEKFLNMKMQYLGYIPYDEKLPKSVMRQQPVTVVYPNAASSRAMLELALLLDNGMEDMPEKRSRGISGLLTKLFRYGR
ncbi:MAG: MinD/ParA family protein [Lachnospiraceae bacterium]|nr:MinD/ParA family protein [Lachnospiraceae bacterium]